MINFGDVLTRAWNIIWKHKILWVFGLLASLAASGENSGNPQTNFNFESNQIPPGMERFFENISPLLIIFLIAVALALVLVVIVLSTIGRAGLVRGAWLADSDLAESDGQKLSFSRLFNESRTYFWRVLLLGVLMFAIGLSLILLLTFPALLTFGIALICLWPLFCLLVPAFWALSVLFKLAIIAIVGEDLGVTDGLKRAWAVFRAHIVEVIVMAIILTIAALVVNFIAALPLLMFAAPVIAAIFSGMESNILRGGMLVSGLLFVLYLPVLLAVRGVVESFIDTAWTVTFRRLRS